MAAASLPLAGAAAASAETLTDIADAVLEGLPPASGTVVPHIDIHAPGRTSDLLYDWAQAHTDALGIPRPAMQAYGHAALVMQETRPDCNLRWTTLAGIGAIESWHGTYEGAEILEDGTVSPPIRGVKLDGRPGLADIPDTDGGELDGDPEYDRAMGPMQFIPQTWRLFGTDGNGNGHADPDNIDDAVMSAARYLCAAGGNLETPEGWQRAILAYNQSEEYLKDVRDAAWNYAADVHFAPPPPPEPEPPVDEHAALPAEGDVLPPPSPDGEVPPPAEEGELPPPAPEEGEVPPPPAEEGELPPPPAEEEPVEAPAEFDAHVPAALEEVDNAELERAELEHADERIAAGLRNEPEGKIDPADLELLMQFAKEYGGDEPVDEDELPDGEASADRENERGDRDSAKREAGEPVPGVLAKLAQQIWEFLAKLGITGKPEGGA